MKLGISNIAWPPELQPQAADLLQSLGVRGIEIAPTAVWPDPLDVAAREVTSYRRFWNDRGIEIVALQALLYGRPDLTLFGSDHVRAKTEAYLSGMIRVCAQLGGRVLVFGSPKNRKRGDLSDVEARGIAAAMFATLGDRATAAGVAFCIEANPTAYECDFITTSEQAVSLVREVGNSGFGVHLDAGAMTLSEERIETALSTALPWCRHFHVSEPQLRPIGTGGVDHQLFSATLRRLEYAGWISIEMRVQRRESCLQDIADAIACTRREYCLP